MPRRRRPVLVVDHTGWDYRAVSSAARDAGLLPQAVPNPERARVHLAGAAHFDGLLLPAALGVETIATLVREARRHRPELRIAVLAEDAQGAGELEARLEPGRDEKRRTHVVAWETEGALCARLEHAFADAPDATSPRSDPANWGNAA